MLGVIKTALVLLSYFRHGAGPDITTNGRNREEDSAAWLLRLRAGR